jgi:hypothetical protein
VIVSALKKESDLPDSPPWRRNGAEFAPTFAAFERFPCPDYEETGKTQVRTSRQFGCSEIMRFPHGPRFT